MAGPHAAQARPRRRALRGLAGVALLVALPLAAAWMLLVASLPSLDGRRAAAGLAAGVTIERDARGVVTVTAPDRAAVAFGLGYAHAQDRFFQMDLSRRFAAGELAALVGAVALRQDERARLFRFRAVAREVLARASPDERAIAMAYARGVNAGLASLRARPWEYFLLRAHPQPWRDEDSVLVAFSIWWDLQASELPREMARRRVLAALAPDADECVEDAVCRFLYPRGTDWDAPLESATRTAANVPQAAAGLESPAPIPPASRLDVRAHERSAGLPLWTAAILRGASAGAPGVDAPWAGATSADASWADAAWADATWEAGTDRIAGSNNWAVAGARTASGAALVANDMHLGLRVPPVWYRARLVVRGGDAVRGSGAARSDDVRSGGRAVRDLTGLTLPGTPLLIAGSNGHVAWGYTNSAGNWADVRLRDCNPLRVPVILVPETIEVRGGVPVTLRIQQVPHGVVLARESGRPDRCWVASWLAMNPAATNLRLLELEGARSIDDALRLAPQIGIPQLNTVLGDSAGRVAWTIFGRIPASEDRGAAPGLHAVTDWLGPADFPAVVDPPDGLVWTANARAAQGADERHIGGEEWAAGASYALGARAAQIRDGLRALPARATPADMLRIQLDDRALFLGRWQQLLLDTLDATAIAGNADRASLRRAVVRWEGRATPDAVGYRLVREFRSHTAAATWATLVRAAGARDVADRPPLQFEGPLWQLLGERPLHLLAPSYPSWHAFLLAQADAVIADARTECGDLERCTWGARRAVEVRHPLSGVLGPFARLLDMPTVELPGDHDMPRVQDGAFGASERFAVSPGREHEGYFQLPGGQSGHPLSPYYRTGFRDWATGKPVPFLPGESRHRLVLDPAAAP